MRLNIHILFLLLFFICIEIAHSQQYTSYIYTYTYTPTGNRIQSYVGFAKIATSPDTQEEYTETLDNIQFNIYPNPTKGLLKIKIDTDMKIDNLQIELYDIVGMKIIEETIISKEIELDITKVPSGSYFMKVFVNNKPYYWNILKEAE